MYDYTKLGTVIGLWVLAALFGGLGWGVSWERLTWMGLVFRLLTLVFGAWALVVSLDWASHHTAERLKEINYARVSAAVHLASALKGLNSGQTDIVGRFSTVSIEMVVSEISPLFMVRCVDGQLVEWDLVEEFFQGCARADLARDGLLLPERDFSNWRKAQSITNTIIANGWANKGRGNQSAELTRPLEWVAARFGIETDT